MSNVHLALSCDSEAFWKGGELTVDVAAATRLIDGSRWFLGQAFYWRAWNQFRLTNYPAARADVDRSKGLMSSSAVYLLSGMIDWRMKRLEPAETEFDQALRIDMGQCEAASFLGGVRSELLQTFLRSTPSPQRPPRP